MGTGIDRSALSELLSGSVDWSVCPPFGTLSPPRAPRRRPKASRRAAAAAPIGVCAYGRTPHVLLAYRIAAWAAPSFARAV